MKPISPISSLVGRAGSILLCLVAATAPLLMADSAQAARPSVDVDGTVHIPAFALPESSLLSDEARAVLRAAREEAHERAAARKHCPTMEGAERAQMPEIRRCRAEAFYGTSFYKRVQQRYRVVMTPQQFGGVYTEVFTPVEGIARKNQDRVLINVHGGGFTEGARTTSHLESMPIASIGRMKVVSVDYRQAPEYEFPSASEDVAVVYRALLKTYQPQNIGIYGCSAGGLLTAQAIAWFQKEGLPQPGAVGMFCAGADYWTEGDSGQARQILYGPPLQGVQRDNPYFKHVDPDDPLAFPLRSQAVMAKFPPSLLIASTRDLALSTVAHTHSVLVSRGVEAQLHIWDGLDHAFFYNPDLSQSREVHDVVVRFFDRHLGASTQGQPAGPTAQMEAQLAAQIESFVQADAVSPPAACQALFVGSSSIRHWQSLSQDMAPLSVLNRGFGGSHIEHVNRWFDRVVAPYRPRSIVFYAGENDIAAGKSVQRVLADFDEFMTKKTAALGQTPVYFISLKPSPLRWEQLSLQGEVNSGVRIRAAQRTDLHYIDVASLMLENGKPKDLFAADRLHMTPQGYAIWGQAVRAALASHAETEAVSCHP